MRYNYPFSALVGQDELLLGLLLNVINPQLGGILIRGVKGSGKSTAVYGLSEIMPEIECYGGCKFNCDPGERSHLCFDCRQKPEMELFASKKAVKLISVPLSITEDRLVGNIDIEQLLKEGKKHFIPGVLAEAHRNILYLDEVNLMPDHIIDDILDVSAMGWNRVEREGFSLEHPSNFILIGTMNPEEGELRPQILDRFPLSVEIKSVSEPEQRQEIIRRNLIFEQDPAGFIESFLSETQNLRTLVLSARKLLEKVRVDTSAYNLIVKLGAEFKLDGHRADIAIIKTARTHAALEMRLQVQYRHLREAAQLVLSHRTRDGGLLKPVTKSEIDAFFDENKEMISCDDDRVEIDKAIGVFSGSRIVDYEKK